jgi:hypothetical protein
MKIFNRMSVLLLVVILSAACSAAPTASAAQPATATPVFQIDNPYAPQGADSDMVRGDVTIDSSSLSLAESNPPQVMLDFSYFQPTPCYSLRVEVNPPDSQNRIDLSAYAVAEKDKACALMALATPLQASLNLGSFPKGHYSVWLNGSQVGEFDS